MREVDVLGVRVEMPTNHPIVLLRERDGGRYLPIWIGAAEAAAITYAQSAPGVSASRRSTPRNDATRLPFTRRGTLCATRRNVVPILPSNCF